LLQRSGRCHSRTGRFLFRPANPKAIPVILQLIEFGLIGLAIYCAIALTLLAWPVGAAGAGRAAAELDRLVAGGSLSEPAAPRFFAARDGARRLYRRYDEPDAKPGADLLVLLHGSGSDSRYLARLARLIAATARLSVVTLDLRGHGPEPGRRGDVDAVDQQEQDIADLVAALEAEQTFGRFLLGGHSIGGGLAIRYAAAGQHPKPQGLVLIAPYVHRRSPAARPGSGGWATPFVTRFAGIEMLQRLGIHVFDRMPVLRFEIPPSARDGTETPLYSWRLFASVTPRPDWRAEIERISCPVLVLAAENDSIFRSAGYPEIFAHAPHATVDIIPDIDHFQLVVSDDLPRRISAWLAGHPGSGPR
jgi:pimeloyl-ACP methyl ester carboxylesterase